MMSSYDLNQLTNWARSLREELSQINPAHPWNAQRIADRKQELQRIEARLARETEVRAAAIERDQELAARFYAYRDKGGR
jgi:hypothetical protein